MTRRLLASAVLSLPLSILAATAHADTARSHSVRLFGKTFCFSWTPADAACDWRPARADDGVVRVLGMTLCTSEAPAGVACDFGPPDLRLNPTPAADGAAMAARDER